MSAVSCALTYGRPFAQCGAAVKFAGQIAEFVLAFLDERAQAASAVAVRRSSPPTSRVPSAREQFYRIVRRIPAGRVTTYGTVASLAGKPRAARQVGVALATWNGSHRDVPWHRVLGSRGRGAAVVSVRDPAAMARQRTLLEKEGVRFDENGRVRLAEFGWRGSKSR